MGGGAIECTVGYNMRSPAVSWCERVTAPPQLLPEPAGTKPSCDLLTANTSNSPHLRPFQPTEQVHRPPAPQCPFRLQSRAPLQGQSMRPEVALPLEGLGEPRHARVAKALPAQYRVSGGTVECEGLAALRGGAGVAPAATQRSAGLRICGCAQVNDQRRQQRAAGRHARVVRVDVELESRGSSAHGGRSSGEAEHQTDPHGPARQQPEPLRPGLCLLQHRPLPEPSEAMDPAAII